jgi:hypothetical protein
VKLPVSSFLLGLLYIAFATVILYCLGYTFRDQEATFIAAVIVVIAGAADVSRTIWSKSAARRQP